MGQRSNKRISPALVFWGGACISILLLSNAWSQTFISGKVITADEKVVASGAVAFEKGELHNDAFLAGGAIASDGSYKIPLPSLKPWGLNVYSEGYNYFPLQVQIKADTDNEIPVILPVDGKNSDDPRISDFRFEREEGRAELELLCRQNQIRLQGSSRLPDRSGDWFFDKLQNARAAGNGKDLFAANFEVHFVPYAKRLAARKPVSKSALMSATSSRPTERRIMCSVIPAATSASASMRE